METDFTKGKIVPALVRFVFPIMFAMLIQSLYGAVDLMIVGQFSDAANVSAVSVGSQIMQTVTLVFTELAVGTTVLLGQYIGQGKPQKCSDVVGATLFSFTIMGIVVAVAMQWLSAPAAGLLNAPAQAFDQTVLYARICSGGAVFIVAYNVLGSIFRGIGDAKLPLLSVFIAAVFNVFGDLLFVAGLHMGAAGAAIATVMAQALSVAISLMVIGKRGMPFPFSVRNIGFHRRVIGRILRLGTPIALQDLLVSISFLIIMAIVNRLGVVASAGIGVAEKLCGFIMLLPSAFSQAMSSFVAQNVGAGKMRRAEQALKWGIGLSFACSLVLGYISFFHGVSISAIFAKDMDVCRASAEYLKAYGIDCLLTSFLFCFIGFFNGCAKTGFVMLQGIVGAFCVRVPLSILFSHIEPVSVFRIGLATPSSSFIQIVLCFFYFFLCRKRYIGPIRPENRTKIRLSDHFTYGKLLRFTFPSMVTSVFISLYGVVDGLFITNFSGKSALAAINFVYPILNILSVFGYMVGAGGSALVAKSLGEKKTDQSNALFSLFVSLCTVLGVALTIVGFFVLRPILAMLGAEGQLLDQAVEYGYIVLVSLTFWNLQYLFQIFFVTAEKPKLGLYVTLLAGVSNMVLDALFIAVFKWGLAGAAAATAIGQVIGGGLPLIYFFRKNNSLLRLGKTEFDGRATLKGITNGMGELLSGISSSLVGILYNSQLLRYAGEDGVAAYGIMMYVSMIFSGISLGYVSGSAPIVAYHYGAADYAELKNLLKKSVVWLLSSSAAMYLLSNVLSVPLSKLFAGYDAALYHMTLHGFRIFAVNFLFMGLAFFGSSFFTALNNGLIAAILSFLRTFVFQVAAVLLLPLLWDIDGIWISAAVAQGLAMICTILFLVAMRKTYHYA